MGSLGSQTTTRLTAADSAGAYLPPGWLLFVRNGILVAQGFDASRAELRGEPLTVADPVGFNARVGVGAFSTSATGAVVYGAILGGTETATEVVRPLGHGGRHARRDSRARSASDTDRDARGHQGRWFTSGDLARRSPGRGFADTSRQRRHLHSRRRALETRLTVDEAEDINPVWSPDGNVDRVPLETEGALQPVPETIGRYRQR